MTSITQKQFARSTMRKINNTFSRGSIKKTKNAKTQLAQISLMNGEGYNNIEFPQDYGFISRPPAGSEIIGMFFGGNRDHGSVLKSFNKNYTPTDLEDGEMALYHLGGSRLTLDKDKNIVLRTANGTVINVKDDDGTVRITGTVYIEGDLHVSGVIHGTVVPP